MTSRRIEITLNEERYQKLLHIAQRRGQPLAAIIDDAIDELTREPQLADAATLQSAIAVILHAPPMPLPDDPAELRQELDTARDHACR